MRPRFPAFVPKTAAAIVLATAAVLAGCLPTKLVIDLDAPDGRLDETAVLSDGSLYDDALPKIAVIDVKGLITHASPPGLFASRSNPVDSIVSRLTKAEEDPKVKAIILRVNSPGGTVAASETLYREIEAFKQRSGKPVVASFAEVAASGGYYLSLAADRIVAQPTSITGSIGVIMQTFNFSKGMSMIGVSAHALTSKENKDLANPFEPPVEGHYAILQGMVDEFYGSFRALVLSRRPTLAAKTSDDIETATDGRVFTGKQARELGLVDELGGLREAFTTAKQLADVSIARLMAYHAKGLTPTSPYAATDLPLPAADHSGSVNSSGVRDINVVQVSLPDSAATGSGFYYLWTP